METCMDVFPSACMLACGLYLLLVIERVVGDLLHCLARSNNNVVADIVLYAKGMLQQGK